MINTIEKQVIQLSQLLLAREWKLATAESCTGGGLGYWLTSLAGSSNWFERGFITYSNLSKEEMLGVRSQTLKTFGAVSAETAREMAEGALEHSQAQISVAITGIAGPEGGSVDKPVGTVWIGCATINSETQAIVNVFTGDRQAIREKSIEAALQKIVDAISN